MSRISQYNTKGLVKFLLIKKSEEIKKSKKELGSYIEKLVFKRIPQPVTNLYQVHPKFLMSGSSVQVSGFGFEYKHFDSENEFPKKTGGTTQIVLEEDEVKELKELDSKYEELLKNKRTLEQDLNNLIYSLRTYKKIMEVIPESKEFLQDLCNVTLVPAVTSDVASILNRLK